MKYLFTIKDRNSSHEEDIIDKSVIKKLDSSKNDEFKSLQEQCNKVDKQYRQSFLERNIWFVLIIGFILLMFSVRGGFSNIFKEGSNTLYTFIVGVVVLVIGFSVVVYFKTRRRKFMASDEKKELQKKINDFYIDCQVELDVPADAPKLHFLFVTPSSEEFVDKKGNKKTRQRMRIGVNVELTTFVRDDMLCFSDIMQVIGIPKSSIKSIDFSNTKLRVVAGNNHVGMINKYYSIHMVIDGEDYELYILPSEYNAFCKVIGYGEFDQDEDAEKTPEEITEQNKASDENKEEEKTEQQ